MREVGLGTGHKEAGLRDGGGGGRNQRNREGDIVEKGEGGDWGCHCQRRSVPVSQNVGLILGRKLE